MSISSAAEKTEDAGMDTASCTCPSCNSMTEITGLYMLAPNETHSEPCDNCGMEISMWYGDDGNWRLKVEKLETES